MNNFFVSWIRFPSEPPPNWWGEELWREIVKTIGDQIQSDGRVVQAIPIQGEKGTVGVILITENP